MSSKRLPERSSYASWKFAIIRSTAAASMVAPGHRHERRLPDLPDELPVEARAELDLLGIVAQPFAQSHPPSRVDLVDLLGGVRA